MEYTCAINRYICQMLYLGTLQQESTQNLSYQTHVTDISAGRTCTVESQESRNGDSASLRLRVAKIGSPVSNLFGA